MCEASTTKGGSIGRFIYKKYMRKTCVFSENVTIPVASVTRRIKTPESAARSAQLIGLPFKRPPITLYLSHVVAFA